MSPLPPLHLGPLSHLLIFLRVFFLICKLGTIVVSYSHGGTEDSRRKIMPGILRSTGLIENP